MCRLLVLLEALVIRKDLLVFINKAAGTGISWTVKVKAAGQDCQVRTITILT